MSLTLMSKGLSASHPQRHLLRKPIDMSRIGTLILGGGQGTRLMPLTSTRCKPAICFGGIYCLIDIAMSNAINSGCSKIYVLTQYLSSSLHQHISRTYRAGSFFSGSIELLTPEQTPVGNAWFQGTADAIRQHVYHLHELPVDYFLILSGDQLYNMDFKSMIYFAQDTNADLVIATLPISEVDANRMGVLKLNEDGFVTDFCEKPKDRQTLDRMKVPEFIFKKMGVLPERGKPYLGSMGIYLFKKETLLDLLNLDPREDFGKHLIPTKVAQGKVASYVYNGYWEDIGTIESFYQANIALTSSTPPFNCYDEKNPIFALPQHLPPPRVSSSQILDTILCPGSKVEGADIKNSIVGPRIKIKHNTIVKNSYLMGNDSYYCEHLNHQEFTIGSNCVIEQTIIDKQVTIGNGVKLINKNNLKHFDGDNVYIREGIIIVPRGAKIPDNYIL